MSTVGPASAGDRRTFTPDITAASPATVSPPHGAGPVAGRPVGPTFRQCQNRLRQRLTPSLLDMFRALTGLQLHAWWHEPVADGHKDPRPVFCPKAGERSAGRLSAKCKTCWRTQWPLIGNHQKKERYFSGLCGSINYCLGVDARSWHLATFLVQEGAPSSRTDGGSFVHAVSLARLIVHDLEATLAAGQRAEPSERISPEPAQSGLGAAARSCPEPLSEPAGGSHRQQLVRRMSDYIQENYWHPLQLGDLATAMSLNASYVSDLFSSTTGVTFHRYVEEFRLAKARELLGDPRRRIREVACAVGYPNPNHFRNVFTARFGIPPSAWRQRSLPVGG